jgi:hypothetical protein
MKVRALAAISRLVMLACDRTSATPPSSPSPQVQQFASADEALDVLKTGQGMGGRCGTYPHAIAGEERDSTGQLSCFPFYVSPSPTRWNLLLVTYSNTFFPEAAYRKECESPRGDYGGWWVVWEPGQNWYAEISAEKDFHGRTPPEFVATAVADALHSTAWNDCSAVN